jgi:hypothetical protein
VVHGSREQGEGTKEEYNREVGKCMIRRRMEEKSFKGERSRENEVESEEVERTNERKGRRKRVRYILKRKIGESDKEWYKLKRRLKIIRLDNKSAFLKCSKQHSARI